MPNKICGILIQFNWGLLYKIFKTNNFYYLQKIIKTVKENTKIRRLVQRLQSSFVLNCDLSLHH